MNIFVLDYDPTIAARYHCDQHLHKMILESAQMLSTWVHKTTLPTHIKREFYKPTHPNHPCTLWLSEQAHRNWLTQLCFALDDLRMTNGSDSHKSMEIIKAYCDVDPSPPEPFDDTNVLPFVFCGPDNLRLGSVVQQYQVYYRKKAREWAETKGVIMSWKGRSVPTFMEA